MLTKNELPDTKYYRITSYKRKYLKSFWLVILILGKQ